MDSTECSNNESSSLKKKAPVFRYKFTDDVIERISIFSKIHKFDNRADYKEFWEVWLEDNYSLVEKEERRLADLGYTKCVRDKMFKAGRYYFRKKTISNIKPVERRNYITISSNMLTSMDEHIMRNINVDDYTPASGYDSYCQGNRGVLANEIEYILKNNNISSRDIAEKIKKKYKNRYFIISRG